MLQGGDFGTESEGVARSWPNRLRKGGVGKLHGIYKGNVKNVFSRKTSKELDGKIYSIWSKKGQFLEEGRSWVEWMFDGSKKEWPEVKEKLGSMENILWAVEFRQQWCKISVSVSA